MSKEVQVRSMMANFLIFVKENNTENAVVRNFQTTASDEK